MKHFVLLLTLLFLTACAGTSARMPTLSEEEIKAERSHQRTIAKQAKAEDRVKRAERIASQTKRLLYVFGQLSEAARGICDQFESDLCDYEVELDPDGSLNAYADGEKIVVTSAMMDFAEKDEELALVIGHELAHNIMEHPGATRRNIYAGAIAGSVVDLFAASQGLSTDMAFTKTGAEMGKLSYSSDYEAEADYIELYIVARAGYNITKSKEFWRRMAVKNPKAIFISTTHPTSAERYLSLEKTTREIADKRKEAMRLLPEKSSAVANAN